MKKVAVIIINYNTPETTEKAARRTFDMEPNLDKEILVIDNNSEKKVNVNGLSALGITTIFNSENYGFAKAVNQGIKNTDSEYVLLLNSDVLIDENAISKMIEHVEGSKNIGIIGPMMLFPDGRFQPSFGYYPTLWREFLRFSHLYKFIPGSTVTFDTKFHPVPKDRPSGVGWLTGGCMLIRREMIKEIGIMDEKYFLGVEDFDICYRARQAGWQVVYYPISKVVHYHGFSSGGTRSTFRIEQDRNGIDYFLNKFFPQKMFSRLMIRFFHNSKIIIVVMLNSFQHLKATKILKQVQDDKVKI